jgi:hypothetical protein
VSGFVEEYPALKDFFLSLKNVASILAHMIPIGTDWRKL